ncbi:STAS domain-containing protein [Nocardia salmonicida]|uniref:STAS domain-containing protein n=1 Tax=Nocardia salmonicida TaxID=53431 RepID=UPI0007A3C00A|nr:STAS domain-containing protein [Nocardia salmonicida]
MDPRNRARADPFPLLDGDPVDTCTRLRAQLHARPTITIVTVRGEVDAYTQKRWRHILDTALSAAEESGRLAIDVADAAFLGCGSVLDLAQRAQLGTAHGVQVSVIDSVPSVLDRIITIAGLTEWLPVHTDLAQMLATGPRHRRAGAPTRPTAPTPRPS